MNLITIISSDPVVKKLLQYMVSELPEPEAPVVLLDADQMERLSEFSEGKIILFSASADPACLAAAKDAGVAGFWYLEPKIESLSRVLMGKPAFPENVPAVKLGQVESSTLTSREMDVLRQLVSGKSDADIAAALKCSLSTVKHYIQSLREKSGIHSRVELAIRAAASGLIRVGSEKVSAEGDDCTFDQ